MISTINFISDIHDLILIVQRKTALGSYRKISWLEVDICSTTFSGQYRSANTALQLAIRSIVPLFIIHQFCHESQRANSYMEASGLPYFLSHFVTSFVCFQWNDVFYCDNQRIARPSSSNHCFIKMRLHSASSSPRLNQKVITVFSFIILL